MTKIRVLGIDFDSADEQKLLDRAIEIMSERSGRYVVTPNSEIVLMADKDEKLKHIINSAEIVLPDGIGVVYASKILRHPLNGKIAGIDFAHKLLSMMGERRMSVYLLGGKPGVAEAAREKIKLAYPGITVSGTHDGYFNDDRAIIEEINQLSPDFLMVCLGAPKQEYWMAEKAALLNVGLMAGLGGVLDVYSGRVERAPEKWVDLGLEWLYRLIKEPKRITRMVKLPLILIKAVGSRIKNK